MNDISPGTSPAPSTAVPAGERAGAPPAGVDDLPALVRAVDADGSWRWWNRAWAARLGERDTSGWCDGIHADDRGAAYAAISEALSRSAPVELEYRLQDGRAGFGWVLERGTPLADGGLLLVAVDVDERRRDHDATAMVTERLLRLQTLAGRLAQLLSAEDVVAGVSEHAVAAAGATAGSLAVVAGQGDEVRVVAAHGYGDELLQRFSSFPVTAPLPIAESLRTGRPLFVADVDDLGPDLADVREVATANGTASIAVLPLVLDGRAVGAVGLSFATRQPFDQVQQDFLNAISRQCATAMERARLYAAEQAARRQAEWAQDRLAFLAEASALVSSSLDRGQVLDRLTRLALPRLGSFASVYLPVGDRLQRVTAVHVRPDCRDAAGQLVGQWPLPVSSGAPAAVAFRTGEPQVLVTPDAARLRANVPDPAVAELYRRMALETGLVVPLITRGRPVGVMAFGRMADDGPPTTDDVALALELAGRAAAAIENATVYEREHEVAGALQHAVLPERLPAVEGLELAARYLPASPGIDVGGDWYDAFPLDDHHVALTVGDVVGHGLRAASVMGQVRNALRAYAFERHDPDVTMALLDRLVATGEPDDFVTAVHALVEPATGRLRWVNAGHPPPVLVTAAGCRALHDPRNVVLGTGVGLPYRTGAVQLAPGDLLLLFTDGLIERRDEHLADGLDRLAGAAHAARTAPVADLCQVVLDELLGGAARHDDVCLLAVRRH